MELASNIVLKLLQRQSTGESFCDTPSSKFNVSFGDVAIDLAPSDLVQLEVVELQDSQLGNMTDNDFVEMGGEVPVQLDIGKSKVQIKSNLILIL